MTSSLVQYIVVRGDLVTTLKWPVGALIAQACHACTAAIHLFYDDPSTKSYLDELDSMHKIVLEAPTEESIKSLAEKLSAEGVQYKLWIEQPEDFPTCLALKPYPKEMVQKYFKKLKLFS